jgi:DNA-binding NarL/FixJ family response regulator
MDPDLIESLTRREAEVLRLLDARLSNKEIATVLQALDRELKALLSPADEPSIP